MGSQEQFSVFSLFCLRRWRAERAWLCDERRWWLEEDIAAVDESWISHWAQCSTITANTDTWYTYARTHTHSRTHTHTHAYPLDPDTWRRWIHTPGFEWMREMAYSWPWPSVPAPLTAGHVRLPPCCLIRLLIVLSGRSDETVVEGVTEFSLDISRCVGSVLFLFCCGPVRECLSAFEDGCWQHFFELT